MFGDASWSRDDFDVTASRDVGVAWSWQKEDNDYRIEFISEVEKLVSYSACLTSREHRSVVL